MTAFRALKSTQNLHLSFLSGGFLGTNIVVAEQREVLGLVITLSSIFALASASPLRAYGVLY